MAGAQPLAYREIAAWCELTGEQLCPWEVRAVHQLDDRRRVQLARPQEQQVSNQPMTPALFDAMFQ